MKKLRRSSEAEVIAEFLKNEFYQEEFQNDRDAFEALVLEANLADERQNALRRALLFRRRGHMWRELPEQTQWWEVELDAADLDYVRVFPRSPWRGIAGPGFWLRDVAHRIRAMRLSGRRRAFIARVLAMSYRLRSGRDDSAVLLIGTGDQAPLTILEGNHRLTAALLAGPGMFGQQFRVFAGLSPQMERCCWYETNVTNLWRYAQNRLRNLFYDRDADVARLLQGRPLPQLERASAFGAAGEAGRGFEVGETQQGER